MSWEKTKAELELREKWDRYKSEAERLLSRYRELREKFHWDRYKSEAERLRSRYRELERNGTDIKEEPITNNLHNMVISLICLLGY